MVELFILSSDSSEGDGGGGTVRVVIDFKSRAIIMVGLSVITNLH